MLLRSCFLRKAFYWHHLYAKHSQSIILDSYFCWLDIARLAVLQKQPLSVIDAKFSVAIG
jgi:hypothetical protein